MGESTCDQEVASYRFEKQGLEEARKRPMSNKLRSEKDWNDGRSESKFPYTCKSNSAVHRRQNHCDKLLRKS